ncbi:MAG: DUF599 domain-containing protein [Gammaproteobacteria bacterium]|nr:DUF599 domain-containing protein [Gammaproteobacteria bacterium]
MDETSAQLIPTLDLVALIAFLGTWVSYVFYTKRRNIHSKHGLLAAMNRVREQWTTTILERENRIVDSQVINGLVRKETFFASTTLLILASTVALLGMGDQVNQLFRDIPFAREMPLAVWELKVAVLAVTFVYAFFKFTWSIRQHSYCAILLAAIPLPDQVAERNGAQQADRLARLSNLAARHFNDGMRAYYFALAELSWFFNTWVFLLAIVWVVVVLYRREFHSKALTILT